MKPLLDSLRPVGLRSAPAGESGEETSEIAAVAGTHSSAAERRRFGRREAALLIVLLIIAGTGFWWWSDRARYERTDNAYVRADIVSVTAQTEGFVSQILVEDNVDVRAGDPVVTLDQLNARTQVERDEAELSAEQAALRTQRTQIALQIVALRERRADLVAANAERRRAEAQLSRIAALAERGWVTRQALETAEAAAEQARAAVLQAEAAVEAAATSVQSAEARSAEQAGRMRSAAATAAQGTRNLARTSVLSPITGQVANRAVRVGQHVDPGATLMSIVPRDRIYIVANFKETQIARIRAGQPVRIRADAYGDRGFEGRVESLAPATGSEFALLPVESATGTFTRVVQRVPVRIVPTSPDGWRLLRPGLSVRVAVLVE
jgi:membrane fusion protein (multidrug efflux system)